MERFVGRLGWVCLAVVMISGTIAMEVLFADMAHALWREMLS